MIKYIAILLLLTGSVFAHEDGTGHLHLMGFLHSSEFIFLLITFILFYTFLKYREKKNV